MVWRGTNPTARACSVRERGGGVPVETGESRSEPWRPSERGIERSERERERVRGEYTGVRAYTARSFTRQTYLFTCRSAGCCTLAHRVRKLLGDGSSGGWNDSGGGN